jgi:UDPglucose 6-dehydrogenase
MSNLVIGYAGMTHLGLCSAVAAADKGLRVVCYDADRGRVDALKNRRLHVNEPDLPELLAQHAGRISFTTEPSDLAACAVVYIAPDVPTDDQGKSDLRPVDALIDTVDAVLPHESVLVVLSQVPPGFSRSRLRAERPLYYQVETLIFGRAMERARFPERFIVGAASPEAPLAGPLAQFLAAFDCPILTMRYESAELAKISINMCLVASVAVANTMAEVCESVGADWSEIVPALKLDRRIGQFSYLSPGLGISGGNLERDLATVLSLAHMHGTDGGVVDAWLANSRHRKDWPWRVLQSNVLAENPKARVAVLGLAYKENTHSTKNSPSLVLLSHLRKHDVVVHDPVVTPQAAGISFSAAASALDAATNADAVCIMTPWPEFRALDAKHLASRMRGPWLIDPYRVVDPTAAREHGLRQITLGVPAC